MRSVYKRPANRAHHDARSLLMKAAYINAPGPPENIVFGDLPKPTPAANEALVKIRAVAVNPIDTYIRSGMYPAELPQPYIVGNDFAGVVEAVGSEVARFRPGDRVWGSNQGRDGRQGTFCEFAAIDECWLYPTPDEVADQDAAAIALVGITAHLGLFHEAQLKVGERVFVNGGSGGVGGCVIQMARVAGARVLASAGTDAKVALCRQLGANGAIHYHSEDLEAVLQKFGPIDVWFDTAREHNLERVVRHMAIRGRIVVMAGRDSAPTLPIGPFYVKNCRLLGYAMFNALPEQQRKSAAEINRWMARGRLRPQIGRVMPLAEAAAAHRLQEENTLHAAGTLAGKIVLTP
jgi:NADPH:quinone reductase